MRQDLFEKTRLETVVELICFSKAISFGYMLHKVSLFPTILFFIFIVYFLIIMYVSFHLIKMPWLKDGNDDDVDEQPRFAVKNTHYWNVAIYSL